VIGSAVAYRRFVGQVGHRRRILAASRNCLPRPSSSPSRQQRRRSSPTLASDGGALDAPDQGSIVGYRREDANEWSIRIDDGGGNRQFDPSPRYLPGRGRRAIDRSD
jgi:hypothetical protein